MGLLQTEGLPILANFALTDLPGHGISPRKGSALIHIVAGSDPPRPSRDDTIDSWAENDQLGKIRGSCSLHPLQLPRETEVSRAILMTCDESTEIDSHPRQRDVSVYWEFHGKRFATYLTYEAGAKAYDSALILLMETIRQA